LCRLRDSDLLVEKREIFFIPHLYLAPPQGRPRRNYVKTFDADKTRMIGLPYGEKTYDNILSHFHPILERYGRTDRRTDGHNSYINIAHSRVSVLTRDKNREGWSAQGGTSPAPLAEPRRRSLPKCETQCPEQTSLPTENFGQIRLAGGGAQNKQRYRHVERERMADKQ